MFKNFVFKPQYGMALNFILGTLCFLLTGVSLVFTILAFCYFFAGGMIGGILSIKTFNEETNFINEKLKQMSTQNAQNAGEDELEAQDEANEDNQKIDYSKIDKKIKRDARSYKISLMFSVIINCLVIYISLCSFFRLIKFLLF